jgi:hypothetical protein
MPINAVVFMEKYKLANARLGNKYPTDPNLFDPFVATIMCNLFLASSLKARHPDVDYKPNNITRTGYDRTNTYANKLKALMKWNPFDKQVRSALDAGVNYYDIFGIY